METNGFTRSQRRFQKGCVLGLAVTTAYMLWFIQLQAPAISIGLVLMLIAAVIWIWISPNLKAFLLIALTMWSIMIPFEMHLNPVQIVIYISIASFVLGGIGTWLTGKKKQS